MRIALLGGSFDPIHTGHLQLARMFAKQLSLDRVLLMPTSVPPHKLRSTMAPAQDRLAMCRLAVEGDPLFEVSDLEIARGGASFTADTLDTLTKQSPSVQWYLITGADMFLTLGSWWRFADIARMAVLCAAPRDGADAARLREYARRLEEKGARCVIAGQPVMPVSSTAIRQRIAQGEPAGDWLPAKVEDYIARKGLYKDGRTMSTMMTDEQFTDIIKGRLSEKRFHHSLEVAKEARRLAEKYGADPARAYTAGLLHDILKDTAPDAQLQILKDFDILQDDVEKQAPKLWHAHSGAVFIRHVLGVQDDEIVSAVRYHTTARAGMSLLEKVLYLADFTSADRDYPDVDEMRRQVEIGIEPAMEYALSYSIRELVEDKKAVHPDTVAAYNETVMRCGCQP